MAQAMPHDDLEGASTPDYHVTIGDGGRLVIPVELRRQLGLDPGAEVILRVDREREELRLSTAAAGLRRARALVRRHIQEGGPSLVDELIADRRRAAAAGD